MKLNNDAFDNTQFRAKFLEGFKERIEKQAQMRGIGGLVKHMFRPATATAKAGIGRRVGSAIGQGIRKYPIEAGLGTLGAAGAAATFGPGLYERARFSTPGRAISETLFNPNFLQYNKEYIDPQMSGGDYMLEDNELSQIGHKAKTPAGVAKLNMDPKLLNDPQEASNFIATFLPTHFAQGTKGYDQNYLLAKAKAIQQALHKFQELEKTYPGELGKNIPAWKRVIRNPRASTNWPGALTPSLPTFRANPSMYASQIGRGQ